MEQTTANKLSKISQVVDKLIEENISLKNEVLEKDKLIKEAIIDLGLATVVPGSKLFAVIKGAIDGGLKVPHNPATLPKDNRLTGEHVAKYAESLGDAGKSKFSKYAKSGLDPKTMTSHVADIKKKIQG